MRIIKLSQEVYGFDTLQGCLAYFTHVLPWQKNKFTIMGEGKHISSQNITLGENVVFSYDGKIVAIAKHQETRIDGDRVSAILLMNDSLKVLKDPVSLKDLENELKKYGYNKNVVSTQGWNILDGEYDDIATKYLMSREWSKYL